jgi:RNA polymerase sigma-70 factor (ECF subfamily)
MSGNVGQQLIALLPRLRRFAISLAGRRDLADDLVQTACERALAHGASFKPGTRFDAWVFRILRNAWIDTFRRGRLDRAAEPIEDHEMKLASADGPAAMEARLTLQAVADIIATLPDEQREIMLLVCVEEFTYAETAEIAGIPIGTVMSRLARARGKLAERAGITSDAKR